MAGQLKELLKKAEAIGLSEWGDEHSDIAFSTYKDDMNAVIVVKSGQVVETIITVHDAYDSQGLADFILAAIKWAAEEIV